MEPLFFVPFFEEKPWGGKALSELYRKYPKDIHIGESWELSPVLYRQTFVKEGEYAGMMLSDLYNEHRELFGTKTENFPFVVKLIDARDRLPVQVSGGDMKEPIVQSQGWYVIKAEPGAKLVIGADLKDGYELFNTIVNESLEDILIYEEIKEGDTFFVPPGCLNSIGKGTLIYEISHPLKETTRIYDWGKYTEMHLDNVLDTFDFEEGIKKTTPKHLGKDRDMILDSEFFKLQKIDAKDGMEEETRGHFSVYTALSEGIVKYHDGTKEFMAGETFIMPAGFGRFIIEGGTLIKAYV